MPLYEYQCDACGHRFEVIQKFSDALIEICPSCGGHVHKLFSAPAFQLKGTGWYATDFAGKGKAPTSAPASKADGSKDDAKDSSKEGSGEGAKEGSKESTNDASKESAKESTPAKTESTPAEAKPAAAKTKE